MKKNKKPFGWKSQKVRSVYVTESYYTREELSRLLDLIDEAALMLRDTETPISIA